MTCTDTVFHLADNLQICLAENICDIFLLAKYITVTMFNLLEAVIKFGERIL